MVGSVALTANAPKLPYSNIVLRASLNKKERLKLCCFNSESLFPKIDYIKALLDDVCMDVICVTESWLKPHIADSAIEIAGFRIFRFDRVSRRGGGICIYVKSSITAKQIFSSCKPNMEISLIELNICNKQILLIVVYKPPRVDFLSDLEEILNDFSLFYSEVIICGDFNQDILRAEGPNKSQISSFLCLLDSFDFKINYTTEPTYFYSSGSSLLDLIITNKDKVLFVNQLSMGWKHDFIFFTYDIECSNISVLKTYRDFKGIIPAVLENYCMQLPWNSVYNISNNNDKMEWLNKLSINAYENCVPLRTITIKQTKPPWFDEIVRDAIALRDFSHYLWKRCNSVQNRNAFRKLRNRVNSLVKKKKARYLLKVLDPKMSSNKFWQNINKLGLRDSKIKSSTPFTASDFLTQFSNLNTARSKLNSHKPTVDIGMDYAFSDGIFAFRNIGSVELRAALFGVKSNAIGVDGISLDFIKLIFPFTARYFLHVFNCVLTTSDFPACWKDARILPVPKIVSPTAPADYRPISILPALSKVFERVVQKQITQYLEENNLLNNFQSAYRPNHGTSSALLNIVDDIRRNADRGEATVLVLLDFSRAFDTIDHKLLIRKLNEKFKFTTSACRLLSRYMSDRCLQVCYNSVNSDWITVNCGVPQGSVLGPLLFSLYINDLPNVLRYCSYHIFADDVQIYLGRRPSQLNICVNQINSDIEAISQWSEENRLDLNAKKSQAIIIYKSKVDPSNIASVQVKTDTIPFSVSVRNLGVIITNDLNWTDQINSVRKRVYFILRRLWAVTKEACVELKRKLFLSFVFPHFLYCDTSLFGMFKYNSSKLKLLFNAGVRYIQGLRKYEHVSPYVNRVLGCSIDEYYSFRVCMLVFKLLYHKAPSYLYNKLKCLPSVRSNNIQIPPNTSDILNLSFFVRGISLWNSLPSAVKNSSSPSVFKNNYFKSKNFII